MFSFWSRNQKPPLFLMLSTTNFLRKKKHDRGDGNPPDPPGLSALKMKSLEVPKDLKGKWFNVMLRCNVCLWRFKPKVALTSPGLQTAHIMICYGAEKSENPLSSAVDDGWNPANQLRLVAYPSIYIVWYVIPVGCLGFLPSTVRLKWNPFEH